MSNYRVDSSAGVRRTAADENRYRLLELLPAAAFACDAAGRITFFNRRAAELWGRAPELGESAESCCGPIVGRVLSTGIEYRDDSLLVERSGGERRIVRAQVAPLADDAGVAIGALGVLFDATEFEQARAALAESEARFRQLAEAAFEGLMIHERGVVLDANQAFAELFGFAGADELIGKSCLDVAPLTPESKQVIREQLRHPRAEPFEVSAVFPDGSLRVFETQGREIQFAGRKARVAAMRDITQRKRAEEVLRKQQGYLDDLTRASPAAICMFRRRPDGTSCMPYAGRSYEHVFGIDPAELVEDMSPAFALVHPDDRALLEASIQESMRTMSLWRCEFRIQNLVKGERWVEGSSVPSRDPDGCISWYGYITDVTDRKRLEERLRHSQKMEAVGRLARGIAHDFNNLLTVINGHSRLLLEQAAADAPQRDGLTAIDEAGRRASALVRQLLAFSRGQAPQAELLDLNQVTRQAESLLRRVLGVRIELCLRLAATLDPIRADPSQIEQVLLNLVVNARDAMRGDGTLTIETSAANLAATPSAVQADAARDRFVRLSVADTGEGMSSDVVARLFEPFFTTKEFGKGTGLGLSVVHGIVTQCGGYIDVKSELGAGSTFTILLPAATD
jgi:two-component system cell cycle sensor histidine kinase/response regulator CckA